MTSKPQTLQQTKTQRTIISLICVGLMVLYVRIARAQRNTHTPPPEKSGDANPAKKNFL